MIFVLVILLGLLILALLLGSVVLPLAIPLMLFTHGADPQVLNAETAMVAPAAPMVGPGGMSTAAGRPSQFALGLAPNDALAACGPAAAIAVAHWWGMNPSTSEVMQLAVFGLWDAQYGMHGAGAEQALLARMRMPTRLEPIDWSAVTAEAAVGRPVILDTPGHYYVVDGVRPGNAGIPVYHVGTSGTDLRGGAEWMTAGQINGMAVSHGNVRNAIYVSTPPPPVTVGGPS